MTWARADAQRTLPQFMRCCGQTNAIYALQQPFCSKRKTLDNIKTFHFVLVEAVLLKGI